MLYMHYPSHFQDAPMMVILHMRKQKCQKVNEFVSKVIQLVTGQDLSAESRPELQFSTWFVH